MDATDETPRTPLACIDGEPFVFADVSPIPRCSPRLGLPLASVGPDALCEARGSDLRFVELPAGAQDGRVLAAAARALRTAVDEGVLVVTWPSREVRR